MTERRASYRTYKPGAKFGNVRTWLDGYNFDSKLEARRYAILQMRENAGEISELIVHPVYELQPAFKRDGKTVRAITYEGDFEYHEGGRVVVEDAKGVETDVFKIKRKMFLYQYPEHVFRIVR